MLQKLIAFGVSALVFLAADAVWLTLMGERLYRKTLGDLMAPKLNVPAAVAFYVIFMLGLFLLATLPALKEASASRGAINAAILGFTAYATYDLTNQATLRTWSTTLTLTDLAWGTTLSVVAVLAGYFAARRFG